ncbi:hypothetical protein PENANT_c001G05577 [Penicillium antarcticum]|uniref:CCHC-type domain-containing protein n=1 Tax=Penicillium antarcticum TaxID=416450 RepID=A0A1V6QN27_9EURO|nr:uncharacterized protein N7508_010770 [Penicillium antarcticum]KAJ5295949.1 hypothetical protein N7508_010770 [Penicillium antarcticum]OQD90585.1 hypothetical protein PENANT_c001G05577 [Penicillium antarcticum]
MANSSDEEADSRTASVGAQRAKNPRSTRSASRDSTRPAKRQRQNKSQDAPDHADFVPRGGAFTATPLEVDSDATSSSGSSDSDSDSDSASSANDTANPHAGSTAPAISWNQGKKKAIRTTLGGKRAEPMESNTEKSEQFDAVNDKYWRSRSDSVSSAGSETRARKQPRIQEDLEEGEIDSKSESDDSDSLDSEADDSILLNIGSKENGMDEGEDYDPERLMPENGLQNGTTAASTSNGVELASGSQSKEDAFRRFALKYPTAPTSLVDLNKKDLETQSLYVYFDRNIHDLDLKLPVSCIECQTEGHMADICPTKECSHCGSWDKHASVVCPMWRRCQKCRERGHDEQQCTSKLRSHASEVPCDMCGHEHLESECDFLWKFPSRDLHSNQVSVSISCANCSSAKHLVGDCPDPYLKLSTSSFTTKGLDPEMITNLNTADGPRRTGRPAPPPPRSRGNAGRPGSRGAEWSRSSSDDENDMMSRVSRGRGRPAPVHRGNNSRGNIKFGNNVGTGRGSSRGPPSAPRARPQFPGNGNRRRSPSPRARNPPPPRGGGGGRGRGPSRGPGRARGSRGGGRGRGR